MSSSMDALCGEFQACWRVWLDKTGNECDEVQLTFNAIGFDGMLSYIESKGFNANQIIDYSVC